MLESIKEKLSVPESKVLIITNMRFKALYIADKLGINPMTMRETYCNGAEIRIVVMLDHGHACDKLAGLQFTNVFFDEHAGFSFSTLEYVQSRVRSLDDWEGTFSTEAFDWCDIIAGERK